MTEHDGIMLDWGRIGGALPPPQAESLHGKTAVTKPHHALVRHTFDGDCGGFAATDAERRDAALGILSLQGVQ